MNNKLNKYERAFVKTIIQMIIFGVVIVSVYYLIT